MIKYVYTFKKGEFNKLNNVNQDLKHVFSKYTIYNSIVIGDMVPLKGKHYAKVDYILSGLPEDIMVTIVAKELFNAQKTYKKYIIGYELDENNKINLIFSGIDIDKYCIGEYCDIHTITGVDKQILLTDANEVLSKSREYLQLNQTDMDRLIVDKSMVVIAYKKYKVRLTKEIIPNVKKHDYVDISFEDIKNDKRLFNMYIRVCRGGTTMFIHTYKCIFI